MASRNNLMTKAGREKLEKELKNLVEIKRPAIIKQIQEAREQGDLSENADYDAAKNNQALIEGRIAEIEEILNHSKIISTAKKGTKSSEKGLISIGTRVKLKDFSDNKTYVYTIVGSIESDPDENKISNESQLAKSIIGKKVGDEIHVKGVEEPYKVKILEIN